MGLKHISVLLLPFLFSAVSSDYERQFNCPNGGEPKTDERTGKALQCLPGRRSSFAICGLGHSCFFSGFNYQCCPSLSDNEEEENDDEMAQQLADGNNEPNSEESQVKANECPEGSFNVLSPEGTAIGCGQLGSKRECSGPKMFCYVEAMTKLCCERFENEEYIRSHLTEVSGEVVIPSSGEREKQHKKPRKSGQIKGEERKETKQIKELTGKSNAQLQLSAGTVKSSKGNLSPLLSYEITTDPTETEILEEAIPASSSADEPPLKLSVTQQTPKIENIGEGEEEETVRKNEKMTGKKDYAKGKAMKEMIGEEKDEEDAEEKRRRKAFQQYFLEKINDGWPYDDKFYGPRNNEEIFVVRKRNRPTAIVHFPN